MSRTRSTQRKPTLVNIPPQLDRQSRRINRQQAKLDKDLVNQMGQNYPAKLTGATGRQIKLSDLKRVQPLTNAQSDFFDAYDDGAEAIIMMGSAGVGKTFLALYKALEDVLEPESEYKKIVLVRSFVGSRPTGFLPGTLEDKGEIYELPLKEVTNELMGRSDSYAKLKDMGKIEFHSSSALRGLSFNDSIVIIEEAQNFTWQELTTAMTRIGKNTKVIFCCDFAQNDLVQTKNDVSGLKQFIEVTQRMSEVIHIKFTTADIVRSGIVRKFLITVESLGY